MLSPLEACCKVDNDARSFVVFTVGEPVKAKRGISRTDTSLNGFVWSNIFD